MFTAACELRKELSALFLTGLIDLPLAGASQWGESCEANAHFLQLCLNRFSQPGRHQPSMLAGTLASSESKLRDTEEFCKSPNHQALGRGYSYHESQ